MSRVKRAFTIKRIGDVDNPSPWAFGWTQLLTISGLVLTGAVSFAGLRTFDRWKREKIEEKRLDVALEALSIAYEAERVFKDIRRRFVSEYEWADMPTEGLSPRQIERQRTPWAVLNRFDRHVGFFEKVLALEAKFMAVFGRKTQDIFSKLYGARTNIQLALEFLLSAHDPTTQDDQALHAQMRCDIWGGEHPLAKDPDRVTKLIVSFRDGIEQKCLPLVNRKLGADVEKSWWSRLLGNR
jgi:hypothetical protein